MAGYAKPPSFRPDWDVCWDFSKGGRGGQSKGSWQSAPAEAKGGEAKGGEPKGGGKGKGKGAGKGKGKDGKGKGGKKGGGTGGWNAGWQSQWWENQYWQVQQATDDFLWQVSWQAPDHLAPWKPPYAGWQQGMPEHLPPQPMGPPGMHGSSGMKLPPSLEKRINETGGAPPPAPPDKEFEGSIKSISDKHGYGFISCDEVHRIYGRDVYLASELVPKDTKVLDRLRFRVVLSDKGHPQAQKDTVHPLKA